MSELKNWNHEIPTGNWPEKLPRDLELRLLDALSYASCSPADIWDELQAWFEDHRIAGPAFLLSAAGRATPAAGIGRSQ
ncbi:MAG: hypothetical protein KF887_11670 [Paracoccaceae bacterium]|nr:MAG: hypothetical protein KF887_11670 [Paracoccaceae bacterium]